MNNGCARLEKASWVEVWGWNLIFKLWGSWFRFQRLGLRAYGGECAACLGVESLDSRLGWVRG